eukprot:416374_1
MGCLSSVPTDEQQIRNTFGKRHLTDDEIDQLLRKLIPDITEQELDQCGDEMEDEMMTRIEFENWYFTSDIYIVSKVKKIFAEFDKDGNQTIDRKQCLQPLLRKVVKKLLDTTVSQSEVEIVEKLFDVRINRQEFIEWFKCSVFFEQAKKKKYYPSYSPNKPA